MAAPTPVQEANNLATFTVTLGGKSINASYEVLSVEVWRALDRLPRARLTLLDGDPGAETFALSEGPDLIPGVAITISLGYDSATTRVFSGVIQRQSLRVGPGGGPQLVVEATDRAMAMTLARGNAVFAKVTDGEVCAALITAAGLEPKVTASTTQHEVIVQYDASAWDVLVLRAQACGMGVRVDDGVVTVAPPDTAASPVLTLTYGQSIYDLDLEMDAAGQMTPGAIASYGWNPAGQTMAAGKGAVSSVKTPGNLSPNALASVFGVASYVQETGGEMTVAELTDWSAAELTRRSLAKIRGRVRFQGSALATPGCMVTLAGLGARFNGDAFVSGVHHRMADGSWTTEVEIGLSPQGFAVTTPNLAAPGAAGQLAPVEGLQTGIVKQLDKDPAGEFRVLVKAPILRAGDQGVWARRGAGCGDLVVGDEVALAFFNGDPRYPVILASLYSKTRPPKA